MGLSRTAALLRGREFFACGQEKKRVILTFSGKVTAWLQSKLCQRSPVWLWFLLCKPGMVCQSRRDLHQELARKRSWHWTAVSFGTAWRKQHAQVMVSKRWPDLCLLGAMGFAQQEMTQVMSIAGANIETCGGTFVQMQNDGDPDAKQAGKGLRGWQTCCDV